MSDTLVSSTFYEESKISILGDHVIFCLHCACVMDANTKNGSFSHYCTIMQVLFNPPVITKNFSALLGPLNGY